MNKEKIKRIGIPLVAGILIFGIGVWVGNSNAKVTLNDLKMNAVELNKKVNKLESETTKLEADKKKTLDEWYQAKNDNKELFDTIAKKGQIEKDTASAQQQLDSINQQLNQANADLKSKQDELASVSGQITKAKSDPKTLQAGRWTVGKDIPAGRYNATPVGEGSNFITYNSDGSPDVNTILGSGGESSYTFECTDGQTIQTEAAVKLTPVE
jgi:uncharacterized phage infection (PIP) family protein YhgE